CHDFHRERAGDADPGLLNEAIWHDGQKFAGLGAKKLDESDKHSFCQRQFFQTNGVVNVLFLDDIGGDAERQYAVFSYAAVDRLKTISRLRQGVGEIEWQVGQLAARLDASSR